MRCKTHEWAGLICFAGIQKWGDVDRGAPGGPAVMAPWHTVSAAGRRDYTPQNEDSRVRIERPRRSC